MSHFRSSDWLESVQDKQACQSKHQFIRDFARAVIRPRSSKKQCGYCDENEMCRSRLIRAPMSWPTAQR